MLLNRLDTHGKISTIFKRGATFFDFCYALRHTTPLLKKVYSKRREFAPLGSKFSPFRVDPFKKDNENNLDEIVSSESLAIHNDLQSKYFGMAFS